VIGPITIIPEPRTLSLLSILPALLFLKRKVGRAKA
jgi:hypothetical protein